MNVREIALSGPWVFKMTRVSEAHYSDSVTMKVGVMHPSIYACSLYYVFVPS